MWDRWFSLWKPFYKNVKAFEYKSKIRCDTRIKRKLSHLCTIGISNEMLGFKKENEIFWLALIKPTVQSSDSNKSPETHE